MADTYELPERITSSRSARQLPAPARIVAVGPLFKRMRRARRMTRTQLALKTGLAPAYIRQIEHGRMQASSATLMTLAEGLGVSHIVARAFVRVTRGES